MSEGYIPSRTHTSPLIGSLIMSSNKTNPMNCSACEYMKIPHVGIHCYMFEKAPEEVCYQHTMHFNNNIINQLSIKETK
jgi:hypothetical protein